MTYFNQNAIYVKNEDNLIYKVTGFNSYDGYNWIHLNLELYAGYDEGWKNPENFIEDVQSEQVICYIFHEGINECLEANGYEILENLPAIR